MRLPAASLLAASLVAASPLAPAPAAAGQAGQDAAAPYSEKMAPLSALVGEWRGSGWMLMRDGTRETFSSAETVSRRLSGDALLVEGQHRSADGRLVHDAMAMLTWDRRAGAYRMRTALAGGTGGDFPLEVTPGGFVWHMETPGGRIEFAAQFDGNVWTERGRRIDAEGRSTDFFEMSLQRVR